MTWNIQRWVWLIFKKEYATVYNILQETIQFYGNMLQFVISYMKIYTLGMKCIPDNNNIDTIFKK